ncbi:MAG: Tol biopolymer transporter periplasmic protein [Cyanobium sp.]
MAAPTRLGNASRPEGISHRVRAPGIHRGLLILLLGLTLPLTSCGTWPGLRRSAGTASLGERNREDPALSSQGRVLASLLPRAGQQTVLLQEQPSGRLLPMGPLNRGTPHRSPSLSRNGRYLAVLLRQGERSLPVIWDRASGQLHRLPLPAGLEAERLSLSPDGRTLAIEVWQEGRSSVRLFALSGLLEPDLPAGLAIEGGGAAPPAR